MRLKGVFLLNVSKKKMLVLTENVSKGTFRLDAKQYEAKVGDLRQLSRVVANLRDWSLHRLILITYF